MNIIKIMPLILEKLTSIDTEEFTFGHSFEANVSETRQFFELIWIKIKEFAADEGIKLILGLLLLVVGLRIINFILNRLKKSKLSKTVEPTTFTFIKSMISISLKTILIINVVAIMGVPMSSIVTVVGSCGLAIGLAMQGSLSNIAGGFMLAVLKPFYVGDYIKTGEYEGTVKSLNLFYTKIITLDNKLIIIPNSTVSNSALTDFNAFPKRRVDIEIGASYSAEPEQVKEALLYAATQYQGILGDPAPKAVVADYDDSSVSYKLMLWVKAEDYWDAKFTVNENIKKAFRDKNIEIPFPQLDVNIKNDNK